MAKPGEGEYAEGKADELFNRVRDLVADRFAEARLERDAHGGLTGIAVTVIDPTEQDRREIDAIAAALGVRDWLRLIRAEPADLAAWADLRRDLGRVQRPHSDVLQQYPTLTTTYQRPPVRVYLNPTGETVAAELHARYGEFIRLHVGALPYPPAPQPPAQRPAARRDAAPSPIDPNRAHIVLDGHLSITRGHTATHALLLTNLGTDPITIATNGHLTASIIDPTGAVVGGFTGGQRLPLIRFTAHPGKTVRIPLLVGTASYRPELGYTIPAGTWHLTAPLHLSDQAHATTPPLTFTVTE